MALDAGTQNYTDQILAWDEHLVHSFADLNALMEESVEQLFRKPTVPMSMMGMATA